MAMQLPRVPRSEQTLVVLVFFVCVGVTIALSVLGGWHLYLISVSETTIEFYLNKRDAQRMKKEGLVRLCRLIARLVVVLFVALKREREKLNHLHSGQDCVCYSEAPLCVYNCTLSC